MALNYYKLKEKQMQILFPRNVSVLQVLKKSNYRIIAWKIFLNRTRKSAAT